MANHVARIAARRGVLVAEQEGSSGRAWRRGANARVRIAPVQSIVTYAVALHELGHCLGRGRTAPRLECEANAWAWAIRNAMAHTVDDRFTTKMQEALLGYLLWACHRNDWAVGTTDDGHPWVDTIDGPRPGCPTLPANNHQFWDLLGTPPAEMFDRLTHRWRTTTAA